MFYLDILDAKKKNHMTFYNNVNQNYTFNKLSNEQVQKKYQWHNHKMMIQGCKNILLDHNFIKISLSINFLTSKYIKYIYLK